MMTYAWALPAALALIVVAVGTWTVNARMDDLEGRVARVEIILVRTLAVPFDQR